MKCINCGNDLEENAKFCANCGTVVEQVKPVEQNEHKCKSCGNLIEEGVKFCPVCGASTVDQNQAKSVPFAPMPNSQQNQKNAKQTFEKISKTPDTTTEYEAEDIEMFKRISIVAYLGLLVLIPILTFPKSKFTRYHSNQGLLLLIIEAVASIVISILTTLGSFIALRAGFFAWFSVLYWIFAGIIILAISVVLIYLVVTGIINAAKGRARELPVIGKFRLLKY